MLTTHVKFSDNAVRAPVRPQRGQVYAGRSAGRPDAPFDYFCTLDDPDPRDPGMFPLLNEANRSTTNIARMVAQGEMELVYGPGSMEMPTASPEGLAVAQKYLHIYLGTGRGRWCFAPIEERKPWTRDLLSNSDICEAAKEALPEGAILVTEVLPGLGVTLWCDHPADKLAELEDQLRPRLAEGRKLTLYSAGMLCLFRLAGAVAEVVLSHPFKVDAEHRQVSAILAGVQAGGAPQWTVRAWTAALVGMFEPSHPIDSRIGKVLLGADHIDHACRLLRLLTARLDAARNGLTRPVPSVRAEVVTTFCQGHFGTPMPQCWRRLIDRFMSVYAAG